MATYFSVVQYVPDDVVGERINIGVVVYGQGRTLAHFLDNWTRVRQFAKSDVVASLQGFVHQARQMNEAAIRGAVERWSYGVQLTPPAGSLLDDHELLTDAVTRFLTDPPAAAGRTYRVKSELARLTRTRVRDALVFRLGGRGKLLVRDDYEVTGQKKQHAFDVTVANGTPYFAAEAVTFQVPNEKAVSKNVDSAAYAIQDVVAGGSKFPMAVVIAPPKDKSDPAYKKAIGLFEDLRAEIVMDNELDGLANRVAEMVT